MAIRLVSIELTNRCGKACGFCYNGSHPEGQTLWQPDELIRFGQDCALHGVESFSLGGGEPLEVPWLMEALRGLCGVLHRSLTTNGLPLDDAMLERLAKTGIEKVHVSLHEPGNADEVARVIAQVLRLESAGIRSGINLLVSSDALECATGAARRLRAAGIGNDRIVYLPMRLGKTPAGRQVADVGGPSFQSTFCLTCCAPSPRFASIDWQKQAAWCSYTVSRRPLPSLTHAGLLAALDGLPIKPCGGSEHE